MLQKCQPQLNRSKNGLSLSSVGGAASHRHSQSDGYGCPASDAQCDPFSDIGDNMPQKFATLPRNRNPFEGDQGTLWGADKKEKKEKVGLLGRVTGKKDGKKTGARIGSSGDLRSPNPFTSESSSETNPFLSHYRSRFLKMFYLLLSILILSLICYSWFN